MAATCFTVKEIELYERPVRFRLPFRYGVVTLTQAPQVFARVRIEGNDDESAWGNAAELLAPKWFDKNPELSNEDNFKQLRRSLWLAHEAYLNAAPNTAYGLFATHYPDLVKVCAAHELNSLTAGFALALLDRAVLDAVCRLTQVSLEQAIKANLPGLQPDALAPDLTGFDMDVFLASLLQWDNIYVRHTVGLTDAIHRSDLARPLADGLPETLEDAIDYYGCYYFKLKLAGDLIFDMDRLTAIAKLLDHCLPNYYVTLDGNEQYTDVEAVTELWHRISRHPDLQRFTRSVLFIEQPMSRDMTLQQDVSALSREKALIIDESDAAIDSFIQAAALGYSGVSSKACKGIYRSLINAARCVHWNRETPERHFFLSAEDLSTQPGVALQQDLALACLLGIEHIERNGHFYGGGFPAQLQTEAQSFMTAHPDLYRQENDRIHLRIVDGRITAGSLRCTGFASQAEPDWSTLSAMA
jgi:hypothetical protein